MGIFREVAGMIRDLKLPHGFTVCELGAQQMAGTKFPTSSASFYESLGCGKYVSIDANGHGTLTADLNQPLKAIGRFNLVTDFGTGEHIFDQAQVWRTLHDLTKPGGFIAFDRPTQGYGKHGFYLIDPGLIADLATANGYAVVRMSTAETPRGWLVRGVLRRPATNAAFQAPQQGRYRPTLRLGA